MDILSILIPFVGGLGMFIYGMQIMAQGLENAAGDRMKSLLQILTKNKLMGVLLGTAITAVIQSSSATTVMVVGFVNAGIMNLQQAMGVIMGANIGTTVTGWLVSSVEWAKYLSPVAMAPVAIIVGVVIMLTGKRYATKELANIIIGFGLLFVGITSMSAAVEPLKESEAFCNLFVTLGKNPLLGIAAGAIVTAIIQSSSASVGILQSLAAAGLVPFSAAIYIIMGQNIGTCVTAIISAMGAKKNAKTASLMHLLFNIIGTVIFSAVTIIYMNVANPAWAAGNITQTQISLVHTLFNIATTVLLFPVSDLIIKLAMKIGGIKPEAQDEGKLLLDDRMMETPGIAISSLYTELLRMGKIVGDSLALSNDVLFTQDRKQIEQIKQKEKLVDSLTAGISDYAMKLSALSISRGEHKDVQHMLQVVADMERISDQCENISEFAEQLAEKNTAITDAAKVQLINMMQVCTESYTFALHALEKGDEDSIEKCIERETEADKLQISYRSENIERMTEHSCTMQAGIIFQDVLVSMERISDHARNIAEEKKEQLSRFA